MLKFIERLIRKKTIQSFSANKEARKESSFLIQEFIHSNIYCNILWETEINSQKIKFILEKASRACDRV